MALTLADEPCCGLRSGEIMAEVVTAWNRLVSTHTCLIAPTPAPFLLPLKNLPLTDKPTGAYPNRFHVPAGWTLDNDIKSEPTEMTVEQH